MSFIKFDMFTALFIVYVFSQYAGLLYLSLKAQLGFKIEVKELENLNSYEKFIYYLTFPTQEIFDTIFKLGMKSEKERIKENYKLKRKKIKVYLK